MRSEIGSPSVVRILLLSGVLLALLALPHRADAYAWMIRHDYTGCAMCHADPSGSGLLTPYGQAQGDLLLRTRYGDGAAEEADPSAGFLFGTVAPPPWLLLGGAFRAMELWTKIDGAPIVSDLILMQADFEAGLHAGSWRAAASLGAVTSNGSAAAIAGNVVSREHWFGYAFDDDTLLLRGGRINVPYGLRSIEHTLFVRSQTRTDLNDTQQDGIAIAYTRDGFRGELMGIAGNYQIHPDAFRERGYSGFFEWSPVDRGAIGVSTLLTHAATDIYLHVANTRQAHGAFARFAPIRSLVLMGEFDFVLESPRGGPALNGYATMLQADLEPIQGLHLVATGETWQPGGPSTSFWYGGWLGADWFFAPHADVRFDIMERHMGGPVNVNVAAYMAQVHLYL
jgi:hypothetical protein